MTVRSFGYLGSPGSFYEGPRWREGAWWVSDMYNRRVYRVDSAGDQQCVLEVEAQPSGLDWLPDGSLVVVSMKDHRLLRLSDGNVTTLADLSNYCGGPLNDIVIDEFGRIYVGDFGFLEGSPAPASLKRVDPDGTITVVADELKFPNGAVITADGKSLIVGETFANRYTAFDIEPDGSLVNRRVWAQLGPDPSATTTDELLAQMVVGPDGCSLDAEGHIWSADAVGNRVIRIAPDGSVVDEIIAPDNLGVYACMLGGDDGRTMLLCAAPDFYREKRQLADEAVLLITRVDVPHAGRP